MDPTDILLLLAAGLAMGFINNLAGAAGAIGLLALQDGLGMAEMDANASLRLAALSLGIAGYFGFRSKGRHVPRRIWGYSLLTVPGAVVGALMVREEFKLLFRITLGALLLLVLVQQLRNRGGAAGGSHAERPPTPPWLMVLLFTWLGGHMGFVQVATGLVAIFILSMVHSRDLVEVNAAKMAFVCTSALAANVTLALAGRVVWGPALVVALGAGAGSFAASRWSVDKGHGAVRVVVILICVSVLVRLGFQFAAG